jgi:hypothetical protein
MRNQASANAARCSNQKAGSLSRRDRRKTAAVCLVTLATLCLICHILHTFTGQLACRYLSAFLGREVTIARVGLNSYRALLLENVTIREEGLSVTIPRMLLFAKLDPAGKIGIKRIVLDKPVVLLSKPDMSLRGVPKTFGTAKQSPGLLRSRSQLRLPPYLIRGRNDTGFSGFSLPMIVINGGRLIRHGQTVHIKYLRLTGFTCKSGFAWKIFANLAFTGYPGNSVSKTSAKLIGAVSVTGKPGTNICDSKIQASICLSKLSLADFEAKEFRTKARLLNGKLRFADITAQAYGGTVSGSSEIQVESGEFSLKCDVSALELAELAKSISPGAKGITGELDINVSVEGKAKNPRSWRGEGSARIRNGKLWDVPVFYGLATLIMKPAFKPGTFRQGTTDFKIKGGAISTSNLRLIGEDIGVDARGKLEFDGNLDFTVTTAFTREFMAKNPGVIEITSILSRILDFFIIQHHIGGTLSEPSYQIIPLPVITTIPIHIKNILRTLFPRNAQAEETP